MIAESLGGAEVPHYYMDASRNEDDPPPARRRWLTPEEKAALAEAGNRRYAHLANQRDNWIAFLRRYEDKE